MQEKTFNYNTLNEANSAFRFSVFAIVTGNPTQDDLSNFDKSMSDILHRSNYDNNEILNRIKDHISGSKTIIEKILGIKKPTPMMNYLLGVIYSTNPEFLPRESLIIPSITNELAIQYLKKAPLYLQKITAKKFLDLAKQSSKGNGKYYKWAAELGNMTAIRTIASELGNRPESALIGSTLETCKWFENVLKAASNKVNTLNKVKNNLQLYINAQSIEDLLTLVNYYSKDFRPVLDAISKREDGQAIISVIEYIQNNSGIKPSSPNTSSSEVVSSARKEYHATALFNMGLIYADGTHGVTKNINKAINCYKLAAEIGNIKEAQNNLGNIYKDGEGVPKNPELAFKYLKAATENGGIRAYSTISDLLTENPNVKFFNSKLDTFEWYSSALRKVETSNHENKSSFLSNIRSNLSTCIRLLSKDDLANIYNNTQAKLSEEVRNKIHGSLNKPSNIPIGNATRNVVNQRFGETPQQQSNHTSFNLNIPFQVYSPAYTPSMTYVEQHNSIRQVTITSNNNTTTFTERASTQNRSFSIEHK
jgi:TPR repeat protein